MPDLKERFRAVDGVDAPELWAEARRRAAAPEAPPRAVEWPPGAARRVAVGALAFAVFAVAIVFAWDLANPDRRPAPRPPAVDLAAELPIGWSELPAPPEDRSGAATAWSGSELLVWGGYEYAGSNEDPEPDGFSFDGTTRRWTTLPASPLDGRADAASAWTGSELLIWGGWDGGVRTPPYFEDGAAFDPATRTWRMLPASPLSPRPPFSVWTGEELIVWGSTDRADRLRDGAAYDPSTDTWRRIPDAPTDVTDGSAVWTGDEMIVFGAALDGNNHADTRTAIGIAYDPAGDSWRELPPSNLSPQAVTASWLGDELIAWDYDQASAAYDPGTDSWRQLPNTPLHFSECYPKTVATPRVVFGEFCGQTIVFSADEDRWNADEIPLADLRGGCCRVIETVAAGDVVLVTTHLYGLQLQPMERQMFAYNPSDAIETPTTGEVLEPDPFFPATTREGDRLRMPVVFPDGTQATVVYPIELGLETLGVQPDVSYLWRADPPPRFPIVFLHDPDASIAEYVAGDEPISTVVGRGVEIWQMSDRYERLRNMLVGHWLRYRLPSWTVLVALGGRHDADTVARYLTLRETAAGFPVVGASGPLALSDEGGEGEGPVLAIGTTLDPSIFLWVETCTVGGSETSPCLAEGHVSANPYGDGDFVHRVEQDLRIEDFHAPITEVAPVPFVPEADVSGGVTTTTLTFPDGSEITVTYPTAYELIQHGIQPDSAYESPRTGLVPIMFVHGPPGAEHRYLLSSEPELRVAGPVGPAIGLWRAIPLHESSIDPVYWLLHRRGDWTILVGVPSKAAAQDVADFLIPHVDSKSGMPWIEARSPFELSPFAGEGGGTVLTIGDLEPSPRTQRYIADFANHATVEFKPQPCDRRIEERSIDVTGVNLFGTLCRASGQVIVSVDAERAFAEGLLEDLRIESYRGAD